MAETAPQQDPVDYTDMSVGEVLRRTRVHYGQSIEDIERALRIRASQIEAIESGDLAQLPGRVYAIGFVRSYSEYLGLDGNKMVKLFKRQAGGKAPEPELHFPVGAADSSLPGWWLIIICVLLSVGFLAYWFGGSQSQRQMVEEIPQVPVNMSAQNDTSLNTQSANMQGESIQISDPEAKGAAKEAEEAAETPEIAEKPSKGIILNIKQNSWVEIRDKDGKTMISRVLKAGDQYYVPDRPDLTISIGNAGGVEVEVDGQSLRQLGETGKVLRRLPLDAEYLKKNFAVETAQ